MKNNAEELIDIITKGVEIFERQDDDKFFDNAIDEASKLAINFSHEDWVDLVNKTPIKLVKRRNYRKIKDLSLRTIVESEDETFMQMRNFGVLQVVIKNAPDEILTAVIQKMLKMIEKDTRDYLFSLIYSTPSIVKRLTSEKVKSRLRKLCDKRISSSAIKDERMRKEELDYLQKFKQEF